MIKTISITMKRERGRERDVKASEGGEEDCVLPVLCK